MSGILTSPLNHSQTIPSIQKSLHKRELNVNDNVQNPFKNVGNVKNIGTKYSSRSIRSLKMTLNSSQSKFVQNDLNSNIIYTNININTRNNNITGSGTGSRNFNAFSMYDLNRFKKSCNCG
jgi:hypothetical protein